MFSFVFFFTELAVELSKNGKHDIQLIPGATEIFMLLFADDAILLSSTPADLQNRLSHLKIEADRLYLTVNLDKTNMMVFRMGGHLAARKRWLYGDDCLFVSWYFEPSQSQRVTSWLKTMYNLSSIYSARKSSNHKLSINHKISHDTNLHKTKHTQTSDTILSKN